MEAAWMYAQYKLGRVCMHTRVMQVWQQSNKGWQRLMPIKQKWRNVQTMEKCQEALSDTCSGDNPLSLEINQLMT